MKILTVLGARPQFIKAAIVSHALQKAGVNEVLVHTGQHYDSNMSDVFFQELELPKPSYNLGIGSGGHGAQTGRMLEGVEKVLLHENPDWVLVYGDTNSTLAGILAASKMHIKVAHVEAGLRSFNRRMPEEINRVVADHLADLLFVPTKAGVENLAAEGIDADKVRLVGDVMYDAAIHFGSRAAKQSAILETINLTPGNYVLATIHRAENTDDLERLRAIMEGLEAFCAELPVVLPLHPRTQKALTNLKNFVPRRLRLIEPVGYLDMVRLESQSAVIVTDSGGVQKEAFFHHVPCLTLREETEWVELVTLGWNRLQSPAQGGQAVCQAIKTALGQTGREDEAYGNGTAAERIVEILINAPRDWSNPKVAR